MHIRRYGILMTLLLSTAIYFSGCAPSRVPLPAEFFTKATVLEMPDIRAQGGNISPAFQKDLIESVHQARKAHPRGYRDKDGAVSFLAISGGGANGAFGAGFLNGWTKAGTRPKFTAPIALMMRSGISCPMGRSHRRQGIIAGCGK